MFIRRLLMGSTALRAPEDDRGSEPDDQDLEDDLDPDDQDDDQDQDDDLDDVDDADDQDQDDDEGGASPPPRSRGENRVAALSKTAKEAKEKADRLEREIAELRARPAAPAQPQETQAQFNERVAQMDPVERVDYFRQLDRQSFENRLNQIQFQATDSADKTAFDGLCNRNPAAAKLKDSVERALADMRSKGTTAPRETVLKYLIGERALNGASRATGKASRAAASNRDRQQTRPTTGRGDAPSDTRRTSDKAARNKRLENMEI